MERSRSTRVQSVERAAALLRAVASAADDAPTATALAGTVGLNRTTTWRMLAALEQERLVSRDVVTGTYSLGFGLIDLASRAPVDELVQIARPVLRRLAAQSRETAALAVLCDGVLTYVAEAAAGAVVAAGWRGREVPLHATSTGKVLLAHLDLDDVRRLLRLPRGGSLPRHTPSTITRLAALEEELAVIREEGYAVCRGEFETSAWGVSAPVLGAAGRPVAVVSLWGPSERLTEDRFEGLGRLAISGAEDISGRPAPMRAPTSDEQSN